MSWKLDCKGNCAGSAAGGYARCPHGALRNSRRVRGCRRRCAVGPAAAAHDVRADRRGKHGVYMYSAPAAAHMRGGACLGKHCGGGAKQVRWVALLR